MKKNLTYGLALDAVKSGKLITRNGWNGKNMFVFMRPEDTLNADILFKAKSLPNGVKTYFERLHQPIINPNDVQVKFTAYLCLKSADNSVINGWAPSQTDMIANDWEILD
ncbi:Phage protein [Sphingobacterium faecium PCAi_F2.5]|nr:Phage protein [Sphingobacterium faecium PCAi_F2.5]